MIDSDFISNTAMWYGVNLDCQNRIDVIPEVLVVAY